MNVESQKECDSISRKHGGVDRTETKDTKPSNYTTLVALKLSSLGAGTGDLTGWPSTPTSGTSSDRRELDFQPQLWLTENTSGTLVKRVIEDPVVLVQETEK